MPLHPSLEPFFGPHAWALLRASLSAVRSPPPPPDAQEPQEHVLLARLHRAQQQARSTQARDQALEAIRPLYWYLAVEHRLLHAPRTPNACECCDARILESSRELALPEESAAVSSEQVRRALADLHQMLGGREWRVHTCACAPVARTLHAAWDASMWRALYMWMIAPSVSRSEPMPDALARVWTAMRAEALLCANRYGLFVSERSGQRTPSHSSVATTVRATPRHAAPFARTRAQAPQARMVPGERHASTPDVASHTLRARATLRELGEASCATIWDYFARVCRMDGCYPRCADMFKERVHELLDALGFPSSTRVVHAVLEGYMHPTDALLQDTSRYESMLRPIERALPLAAGYSRTDACLWIVRKLVALDATQGDAAAATALAARPLDPGWLAQHRQMIAAVRHAFSNQRVVYVMDELEQELFVHDTRL